MIRIGKLVFVLVVAMMMIVSSEAGCNSNDDCNDSGRYCSSHSCVSKKDNGRSCNRHYKCKSGYCNHNGKCSSTGSVSYDSGSVSEDQCHDDDDCGYNRPYCNHYDGDCVRKLPTHHPCHSDRQCHSDWCKDYKCKALKGSGEHCYKDWECQSDFCYHNECFSKKSVGGSCYKDYECHTGYCKNHKCKNRAGLAEKCHDDADCESHYCDNDCKVGWICEKSYTCVPRHGSSGTYCQEDRHCASDHCNQHTKMCS